MSLEMAFQHRRSTGVPVGLLPGPPRWPDRQARQEPRLLPHLLHVERALGGSEFPRRKSQEPGQAVRAWN